MGLLDTVFDVAVFDVDCFDANVARSGQVAIESPITTGISLDSTIPAAVAIVLDSTIAGIILESTIET